MIRPTLSLSHRSILAALFFAGSLFVVQAVGPDQPTVLSESIKPVASGAPALPDSRLPFVSRRQLTAAESEAPMNFEINLQMRNFDELTQRLAKGEKISTQEMAAQYEPSAADYQKIVAWVQSQRFTVTRQDSHHMAVFAQGRVSGLQKAMSVTFGRVSYRNAEFTSALNAPSVPAWMSTSVVGVNGLQPHLRAHKHIIKQEKIPAVTGGSASYKPSQIAQAYHATSLYSQNITGAGESIAIVIDTFPQTSDLLLFWQKTGVAQSLSNIQFIQTVAGVMDSPSGEESLDVEWASGMAPDAHVRVYGATDLEDPDLDASYQQVLDDATNHPEYNIHEMSMSFGENESEISASELRTDAQFFAELAAAGVTCFASTGDGGSTPDDAGGERGPLDVENPASDPSVTAVGGTSLQLNGSNNETSETVWNNADGATGGGTSSFFARPVWQTGAGVKAAMKRQIPDVSLTADPKFGAITYLNGQLQVVGGTSWASPSWAALCALLNQARANSGQASIGLLGPQIYPQIGTGSFRDIVSGTNATARSGGLYAATAGFDEASGIGVPLMDALSAEVVGSSVIAGVTPLVPVVEVTPTSSASFSVGTTGSATFQWQRMPIGTSTWTVLSNDGTYSNTTSPNLTINSTTTAMSGDQFRCVVQLSTGAVTTAASVLVVDRPLQVSAFAGQIGITGRTNGAGTTARFNFPSSVAVDSSGNVFVADFDNNEIREISPAGTVTTPYGSTTTVAGITNGTGNAARFNEPNGVAIDSSNNIFVADSGNNLIREITNGVVGPFVGPGSHLNNPEGVAVDGLGNVYVADTGNNVIRMVTPAGVVSTLAGRMGVSGFADGNATTQALFNGPAAVAVDAGGNVYVADTNNFVVRKISGGTVTTVAGQSGLAGYLDGLGSNALFNAPSGLAVDPSGNLYIADSLAPPGDDVAGNDVLRKLSPTGVVSTLAGSPGTIGSTNGTGSAAEFFSLQNVAVSNTGQFYLADTYNQDIRSAVISGRTTANVSLNNLAATYDGTAHAVTTSVTPNGLPVTVTYNGSTTPPTNAGSYAVVASVSTEDYVGTATGTLVIAKASAMVSVVSASSPYTGKVQSTTATTTPAGLAVTLTYNGLAAAPSTAGVYAVVGTINNANFGGTGNGTLTITPLAATVTLGTLNFNYNGRVMSTTASTVPARLPVTITYNGSTTAPSAVGNYAVSATITNPDYAGTASGNLVIAPILPTITTEPATLVSASGAVLNGLSNPNTSDTHVFFQYGTSTLYGSTTATQDIGGGLANVNFSAAVSVPVLSTAVIYHYRAVASNVAGQIFGADRTFTSLPRPAISAAPIASLSATDSEISVGISPEGLATTVFIKYGLDNTYGSTTAIQSVSARSSSATLFALLAGLSPNTMYHYEIVMTSAAGTFTSDDETFTTLSFTTSLVAQAGDAAVGTGSTFASFGNPAININTQDGVAFAATLNLLGGVTRFTNSGIWADDSAGVRQLIAQVGSSAPGTGSTFASFTDPVYNASSAVAFIGTMNINLGGITRFNDIGVWSSSSGSMQLIAQEGIQAPGCPTGATFGSFTSLGLTDNAGAVFLATLATNRALGIGGGNNVGIWEGNTAADLALVVQLGQVIDGKTLSGINFLPSKSVVNGQTRSFNANGDLTFSASFSDRTTGLVTVVGGVPHVILPALSPAAGTAGTFSAYGNPIINDNDHTAFAATLSINVGGITRFTDSGIWADDSTGTRQLIGQVGSVAAGIASTYASLGDPVYNNHDAVAFLGTLAVAGPVTRYTTGGIWCNSSGSLQLVTQEGSQAPGCPVGDTFSTFTELALPDQGGANNQGGVIFLATLSGSGDITRSNASGIWAVDNSGNIQLIVRTGDILNGKTVSSLAFLPSVASVGNQTRSFAQGNGDIVYLVTFSDRSTAIFNVTF